MCEVSGQNIHWCWRYSSRWTNLGRTEGAQIIIPRNLIFLVGDNIIIPVYLYNRKYTHFYLFLIFQALFVIEN